MLQPPVSDLAPWRPGHWISPTGYALTQQDVSNFVDDDQRFRDMRETVKETDRILKKVMRK